MYEGLFGEKIPRTDNSKARGDLAVLRRIFLHALDHCQPIDWKFHEKKVKEAVA